MKQIRSKPKYYTSDKTMIEFECDASNDIATVLKLHESEIPDEISRYVLYRCGDTFKFVVHTSEEMKFNTLDKGCVITNVNNAIYLALKTGLGADKTTIIGYEQPSLPILVEMLQPLVVSLAKRAYSMWNAYFDYDDLEQMCNLCLCDLYNGGYYIHKSLLSTTFNRHIYRQMRSNDHRGYEIVSIYKVVSTEDESLTIEQSIPDKNAIEQRIDEEASAEAHDVAMFERDLLVELIGERQYNELVRQQRFNMLTPQTCKLIRRIKEELKNHNVKSTKEYIWKIR